MYIYGGYGTFGPLKDFWKMDCVLYFYIYLYTISIIITDACIIVGLLYSISKEKMKLLLCAFISKRIPNDLFNILIIYIYDPINELPKWKRINEKNHRNWPLALEGPELVYYNDNIYLFGGRVNELWIIS